MNQAAILVTFLFRKSSKKINKSAHIHLQSKEKKKNENIFFYNEKSKNDWIGRVTQNSRGGKKKTLTIYCANVCHVPIDCVLIMDLY